MNELEKFVNNFNPSGLKLQLMLHGTSKHATLIRAIMKDGFIDASSSHKSDLYAYILGIYTDREDEVAKIIKNSNEYKQFCIDME